MANLEWQLQGAFATVDSNLGSIHMDLARPSAGLVIRGKQFCVEPVFAFLLSDEPIDVIARGRDLILRFPPRTSDFVSYEVQYRVSKHADGVDMILSAQTQLLESTPQTAVSTTFHGADLVKPRPAGQELALDNLPYAIARPSDGGRSLLMMVHPSDFYESTINESTMTFWVFPESLEKGVIRRARFRLRLLDRERDEAQAWEAFSQSRSESPPLTT